ncbi:hypothetical protein ACQEVI_12525 [Promicromonospora sp. CA-289599]|uniref:hypothetical protein n=1 Tax=Promicromonospora sp. CA-289599 TaxID=3240014 RepID=UPI003D8A395A
MRRTVTALVVALLIVTGAPVATAAFGAAVVSTAAPDPTGGVEADTEGTVIVGVETGGEAGETTPVSKPSGGKKPVCTYEGEKVPCTSDDGVWDGACHMKAADPQPPKSDAVWQGNENGLIVTCTPYCDEAGTGGQMGNPGALCAVPVTRWVPTLPGAPDPAVLAQRAVSTMQLRGIDVGIVPEEGPDRVGILGMPQWMWVNEPRPRTFGPITREASAGGATVTATAKVDKVVWDMGDGNTVTCVGPGTPYEDRYDISDSPDCGYKYTKQGKYEVTATSYWTVQWEGIGQTGTIPLDFTSTANIVMGEAQVITQ